MFTKGNKNQLSASTAGSIHNRNDFSLALHNNDSGRSSARSGSNGSIISSVSDSMNVATSSFSPQILVGDGAQLDGNIAHAKSVVISGVANIKAHDVDLLIVTQGGVLNGEISVIDASIEGKFEGSMTVRGKLSIRATALVKADVVYKHIEIENGGSVAGNLRQENSVEEGYNFNADDSLENANKNKSVDSNESVNGESNIPDVFSPTAH